MKVVEPATKVVESDADIFVFELCWFGLLLCVGFGFVRVASLALGSSCEFASGSLCLFLFYFSIFSVIF